MKSLKDDEETELSWTQNSMFVQHKQTGVLVEVLEVKELIDPLANAIQGRIQEGQEEQDPEKFAKSDLVFPSGEDLPRCWLDVDYRTKG